MTQKSAESPSLGELEIQVLEYLWANGECSAKELHADLQTIRANSLNTVQSAMERLHRKSLLNRRKSSHRYVYAPTVAKADLLGNLINNLVERFQVDRSSSAAAIVNAAEHLDEEALDRLEAEIQRRRQERS